MIFGHILQNMTQILRWFEEGDPRRLYATL